MESNSLKKNNYSIAVLPGDGIGPEVMREAIKVLRKIEEASTGGLSFEITEAAIGGSAIDASGDGLPDATLSLCKCSDAVLLGAVGGTKWDSLPGHLRPEKALLSLRKELALYANIRPATLFDVLKHACPLKPEIVEGGFDICVVRELTGGIYFGERGTRVNTSGSVESYDVEAYSEEEVHRIGITAFETAMKRDKRLISVDKANVLESSRLWRRVMNTLATSYPEVTLEHMYVDNAAMQLIKNPKQFDVLVTSNIFGDILSDEASMLTGSIGLLPSASLGAGTLGLYEPIHGSAPDIAGQNIANPIAMILSVAMMLRHTFACDKEAQMIEKAVIQVLEAGYHTPDLSIETKDAKLVGTDAMGDLIGQMILSSFTG